MGQWGKKIILLAMTLSFPMVCAAGQVSLGFQYDGWDSSYAPSTPFNGFEFQVPFALSFHLDKGIKVYGQTAFVNGGYTDSTGGTTNTAYLADLSDSVIGTELDFKMFSVPSLLNVSFNLPTGNSTWEAQQVASNIPTEFIDSRYRGRGFGISALYGLDLPAGTTEYGVAAGYLFSGAFNPSYGSNYAIDSSLKLGDSFFFSLNDLRHFSQGQNQVIRLSGFIFLNTQQNGANTFQMGPNFNASYAWENTKAFSFELGGQAYLAAQRFEAKTNQLVTEPNISFAPRFYLTPSYAFTGDFSVGALVKYVMANWYSPSDPSGLYDGGGWVFGVQPTYLLRLDSGSALKFTASYDDVISLNGGRDAVTHNLTNVYYYYWTLGTSYEVKL